ncbi:hypothetical protein JKP88DRAFT_216063 [Tribonema minus]|uniref:Uncharacterized protein n=1 Tax=Tribonema minus TaxID=303371 RepID=A0A835YLI2_9STRA|nr:hypothetical protein JKP88DRAFT_216063 [Tribonema minus]
MSAALDSGAASAEGELSGAADEVTAVAAAAPAEEESAAAAVPTAETIVEAATEAADDTAAEVTALETMDGVASVKDAVTGEVAPAAEGLAAAATEADPSTRFDDIASRLRSGLSLTKIGRTGRSASRKFIATEGLTEIGWGGKRFPMAECTGVAREGERGFSLAFPSRKLDITANSAEEADELVAVFQQAMDDMRTEA